jgi:Ras-related protein Rab-1A
MDDYDYLFKVLLIGDSSVGKTSVLLRYVDDKFNAEFQTTIGVDFKVSTFAMEGKSVKLQLWDTAGQDRFKNIVASYYRGAHGILLMFDITNAASFQNVQRWFDEAQNYLQRSVPKLLIGNKADLAAQRAVRMEDARTLAERLGVEYVETSAKNNVNVKAAFETLTRNIMASSVVNLQPSTSRGTKVNATKPVQTGCCRG